MCVPSPKPTVFCIAGIVLVGFLTAKKNIPTSQAHKHTWVAVPQVIKLFIQARQSAEAPLSKSTVRRAIKKRANKDNMRHATSRELQHLKHKHVVPPSTTIVHLITIDLIRELVVVLHMPDSVLNEFDSCTRVMPLAQQPSPPSITPVAVAPVATCPGGPNQGVHAPISKTQPNIQSVLPSTLPDIVFGEHELSKKRYGITTHSDMDTAAQSRVLSCIELMGSWVTSPIQLNRPKSIRAIAHSTWQGIHNELSRMLGFFRMCGGIEEPTLHHCLNGHLLLSYISLAVVSSEVLHKGTPHAQDWELQLCL